MPDLAGFLRTAIALGYTVLPACEPQPESAGLHVDYIFEAGSETLCAGTEAHIERYLERVIDFFGAETSGDFQVQVHIGGESACSDSGACYLSAEMTAYVPRLDIDAHRTSGTLRHELTHAVIDRIWGTSTPFFNEGLAEAMSRTQARSAMDIGMPLPVGGMLGENATMIDYTAAAYFTRFLIDTRGLRRFERLFRESRGRAQAEIQTLMAEIYDQTFEALEGEYLAGGPRCLYQLDLCDAEGAVAVDLPYAIVAPVSCNDPDYFGSLSGTDLRIATNRTFALDVGGSYRLRAMFDASEGSLDSEVWLIRCGDCSRQAAWELLGLGSQLDLDAGLYTFAVSTSVEAVLALNLERVESL